MGTTVERFMGVFCFPVKQKTSIRSELKLEEPPKGMCQIERANNGHRKVKVCSSSFFLLKNNFFYTTGFFSWYKTKVNTL